MKKDMENKEIMREKKCEIDYEDEVQFITDVRTLMKKKKPVCVTCNQTFATYPE